MTSVICYCKIHCPLRRSTPAIIPPPYPAVSLASRAISWSLEHPWNFSTADTLWNPDYSRTRPLDWSVPIEHSGNDSTNNPVSVMQTNWMIRTRTLRPKPRIPHQGSRHSNNQHRQKNEMGVFISRISDRGATVFMVRVRERGGGGEREKWDRGKSFVGADKLALVPPMASRTSSQRQWRSQPDRSLVQTERGVTRWLFAR